MNLSPVNPQSTFTAVDFDPFAGGEVLLTAPATESQKEIWASVQMGDDANCAYNESQSLQLGGVLDVEALQSALQELVQRHEALRTTFSPDGTTLCITATLEITIPFVDLSNLDQQVQKTQVAGFLQQAVKQPFDLEHGPLFRAQILKLRPQEHLVLMTAHHIICDGWSWGVLMSELGKLYSALQQGIAPDFKELDRFSEYALLQEQEANSPDAIATEEYWLGQFSDSVPVLDFPTDRPRPPLRTFNAAREDWELDPALVADLKQLGAKLGCSFMTTILAVFEVWLYRLTGQEDIVVGISAAGQAAMGSYNLVGHCVNLLPLRSHLEGEQFFSDYLRMRRLNILDAYDHQQFTFGSLIKKLALPRDPSRIPLVPVTFNIDRALESNGLLFEGLEVNFFSNPRAFENFELFVNATELRGKLILECQYNTNLFDADTIRRRMAEFETLLAGIVANPDQHIAKLPILPEAEQQLLAEWNRTQTAYPQDKCIHQLFEAQVVRSPETVAVVFEDQQLTYRELNQRANQLAHYLQILGVGPEVLVGICIERSLEMVVGILGILKAGGAYVPLDSAYPQERLAFMLQDSQVPVLLTQEKLKAGLPEHGAHVVCLDTGWKAIAQESEETSVSGVTANNLAYAIYTSGSTGQPKGVMISHLALCNHMFWMRETWPLTEIDRVLQKTPISFDASVWEFFAPLIAGARLVIARPEGHRDSVYLIDAITAHNITVLQLVPSMLQVLLSEPRLEQCHSLRYVYCGGEALPIEIQQRFSARLGGAKLYNLYGPTEACIDVTWWTCEQKSQGRTVPIGRPIANVQIYLLDAYLQPVPIGVLGELYIGGTGLARGYLNQSDLTAEKFIPNPCCNELEACLYKTGDLARYRPEGTIEFIGRVDYQVKIRGYRIELGEIEAMLDQHPAVQETVILDREDELGSKRLVAYVVANQEQVPTSSELRSYLKAKLPEFMVPSVFVLLPALPLAPNGKVDRHALPMPDSARPELEESYVAPRTTIEQQIADIWTQVLHLERVGIHDNFFELGGYSLLAIQIISRLRKALQVELPLPSLFEVPTVADLAKRIETVQWVVQGLQAPGSDAMGDYEEGEL